MSFSSLPGLSKGSLSLYSGKPSLFRLRIPKTLPSPLILPPSTSTAQILIAAHIEEEEEGSGGSTCMAAPDNRKPTSICSRLPELTKRLSYMDVSDERTEPDETCSQARALNLQAPGTVHLTRLASLGSQVMSSGRRVEG